MPLPLPSGSLSLLCSLSPRSLCQLPARHVPPPSITATDSGGRGCKCNQAL
jgi:hypothetical protein